MVAINQGLNALQESIREKALRHNPTLHERGRDYAQHPQVGSSPIFLYSASLSLKVYRYPRAVAADARPIFCYNDGFGQTAAPPLLPPTA
jgi:hypothetical protein